jgi:aromatic-L-amino-acid decarboxylase
LDAATFRKVGHELIDWVAAYREELEKLPVMSRAKPGEIRSRLPKSPPESGGQIGTILQHLDRDVLPGITHWNHPGFFAYFPSNTSYASILADIAASGLGVQGMSWQTSPAATEIEEVVLDWLRQMVGLSERWTGVIHDAASTATLCALLCARERSSGMSQRGEGLQSGLPPLAVYASSEAHSSIEKAALLAGFGREHLRLIETDRDHAMSAGALESAIAEDAAVGWTPCAVVATIGTTGTTAIDPLAVIARVARERGLWLHVDAAFAGSAMVLPECRPLWQGVEEADSLVFNPHKWMGVGFDFSAYYVRDPEHLIRVMGTNPSYLRTAQDSAVTNYRDWQIPLGRRFRALKLWFLLLDVGVEAIRARFRRDLENAHWLRGEIAAQKEWELLAPVPLQTLTIRHVPPALRNDEAALARHNLAIAAQVNEGGVGYLTPAVLKGLQTIRVSIGAEATERRHVEALWKALREAAAKAPAGAPPAHGG